ncbi:hypothetical protein [Leptolyngbya sp. ST-U4]|uniref:hypothetical protein n=1 Tax=Leptolyngbya sp. ST-U4 TaxID=2933912 RepID=UPI00329877F5
MNTNKLSDDEIIRDITTRYGEVINLRKTPYLAIEILRTYGGGIVNAPDGGVSVAGVGTPPGPSGGINSQGNVVDNVQIMKEILKLSKQVALLAKRIEKLGGN